jgi:formaldehyde-activating enzyme involved in methanogenesis
MKIDEFTKKVGLLLNEIDVHNVENAQELSAFFSATQAAIDFAINDATATFPVHEDYRDDTAAIAALGHALAIDNMPLEKEDIRRSLASVMKRLLNKVMLGIVDGSNLVMLNIASISALLTSIEAAKQANLGKEMTEEAQLALAKDMTDAISSAILTVYNKYDPKTGESN